MKYPSGMLSKYGSQNLHAHQIPNKNRRMNNLTMLRMMPMHKMHKHSDQLRD